LIITILDRELIQYRLLQATRFDSEIKMFDLEQPSDLSYVFYLTS